MFDFLGIRGPVKRGGPIYEEFNPAPKLEMRNIDPKAITMRGIHKYISQNKVPLNAMEKAGIVEISPKLYRFMERYVKSSIDSLYAVPAARKYFGEDFLHGVQLRYNYQNDFMEFRNMDRTLVAQQFTKEVTVFMSRSIKEWLEKYSGYTLYMHEKIKFTNELKIGAHVDPFYRVVWYP